MLDNLLKRQAQEQQVQGLLAPRQNPANNPWGIGMINGIPQREHETLMRQSEELKNAPLKDKTPGEISSDKAAVLSNAASQILNMSTNDQEANKLYQQALPRLKQLGVPLPSRISREMLAQFITAAKVKGDLSQGAPGKEQSSGASRTVDTSNDPQIWVDPTQFGGETPEMTPEVLQDQAQAILQNLDPKKPDPKLVEKLTSIVGEYRKLTGNPLDMTGFKPKKISNDLNPTVQKTLQQQIIDGSQTLGDLSVIGDNFDPKFFNVWEKGKRNVGSVAEKWADVDLSKEERIAAREVGNLIQQAMLAYRKSVTGVAGGEKEMEAIEDTFINKDLSPAEAEGALNGLMLKYARNMISAQKYLESGLSNDELDLKSHFAGGKGIEVSRKLSSMVNKIAEHPKNKGIPKFKIIIDLLASMNEGKNYDF